MIYLTKVLSVDIRDQFISLAYLGRSFRGVDLIESAVIPKASVPVAGMKEGDDNEYDQELLGKLRAFIEEKKISQEETVMCVPRNAAMLKLVDIPSPDEASLSSILKYELDRLIPMSPSEVYYDYKVLGAAGGNIFKVLLTAIPKKAADYYVGLLKRAGLPPTVLDVSTFGSFNAGYFSNHALSGRVAIIDVSSLDYEVIFIENNAVMFSRTKKIIDEVWKDCFFNGREFLKDSGKTVETLSRNIISDLEQCLDIANEKTPGKSAEKIFLAGGGQSDQVLCNFLRQESGLEVDLLAPSHDAISVKSQLDGTNCLSTAIGLGLGELRKSPMSINLLPRSLRAKRKKSQVILTFVLFGLILLSSLGILGSVVIKERLSLSRIDVKLADIRKKIVPVEDMELKYGEIASQFAELNKLWEKDVKVLAVIKELTEILPADAWLSGLGIKGNAIEVSGRAATSSSLIPALDKSPLFKDVRFDGAVETKDGVDKFQIKMVME